MTNANIDADDLMPLAYMGAPRPLVPWTRFWLSSGVRHLIVHHHALTLLDELRALLRQVLVRGDHKTMPSAADADTDHDWRLGVQGPRS